MLAAALRHRYGTLAVLILIIALVPLIAPSAFHLRVAALVWVFALAAIGLTILTGFAGQISLGHAGFLGLGAYGVAIGPAHLGLHPLPSLLLSAAFAGLVAWLVGRPILRLKGYALAIATLGFGLILSLLFNNEGDVTGGPDGMPVKAPTLFGWRMAGAASWYWLTAGALLLGAWIALNLRTSPAGRALRALHDSETAAAGTGIDVAGKKLAAFVISAVYAAVAGALLAGMNGLVTPEAAGFMQSIELVAMVIIGGLGSVLGAVVGAALLVVLPQALTAFQEYEQALLGLLIMGFMIALPAGIVPALHRRLLERLR